MDLPPLTPQGVASTHAPRNLGYYQAGPIQKIPTAVTVIAIFAIVLGALTVLCDTLGVIGASIAFAAIQPRFTAGPNLFNNTAMKVTTISEAIIGLGLGGVLLAGGIGGVTARRWARKLLIGWAVTSLIFHGLICGVSLYFTATIAAHPVRQQQIFGNGLGANGGFVTYSYNTTNRGVMTIGSTFLSCVFPVFVIVFWRRPEVVAAFNTPRQTY